MLFFLFEIKVLELDVGFEYVFREDVIEKLILLRNWLFVW